MKADEVVIVYPYNYTSSQRAVLCDWSSLSCLAKPAGTVLLSPSGCESTQTNAAFSLEFPWWGKCKFCMSAGGIHCVLIVHDTTLTGEASSSPTV